MVPIVCPAISYHFRSMSHYFRINFSFSINHRSFSNHVFIITFSDFPIISRVAPTKHNFGKLLSWTYSHLWINLMIYSNNIIYTSLVAGLGATLISHHVFLPTRSLLLPCRPKPWPLGPQMPGRGSATECFFSWPHVKRRTCKSNQNNQNTSIDKSTYQNLSVLECILF